MISVTTWGASVTAPLRLYNAHFVGLLRCSLPVLHGLSRSNLEIYFKAYIKLSVAAWVCLNVLRMLELFKKLETWYHPSFEHKIF